MTLDTFKILLGIARLELRDAGLVWQTLYSNKIKTGWHYKFCMIGWKSRKRGFAFKAVERKMRGLFAPEIESGQVTVKVVSPVMPGLRFYKSVIINWKKEY